MYMSVHSPRFETPGAPEGPQRHQGEGLMEKATKPQAPESLSGGPGSFSRGPWGPSGAPRAPGVPEWVTRAAEAQGPRIQPRSRRERRVPGAPRSLRPGDPPAPWAQATAQGSLGPRGGPRSPRAAGPQELWGPPEVPRRGRHGKGPGAP